MQPDPEIQRYAREMREMLRRRDPAFYRAFLRKWRDLHQRGVADRLAGLDDRTLRLRLEHMILDQPELAEMHESARAYIATQAGESSRASVKALDRSDAVKTGDAPAPPSTRTAVTGSRGRAGKPPSPPHGRRPAR
jgi:hypothetical protein